MNHKTIMVVLFGALLVRELWILLPKSEVTFDPFPFYNIQITRQTYVGIACTYVSWLIISYCFCMLIDSEEMVMRSWFCLQAIEFVDYFFTYNTAWFTVFGIGIGITVTKFTVLFTLILHRLWRT